MCVLCVCECICECMCRGGVDSLISSEAKFDRLISIETKQRVLSYQFGFELWIYFVTLLNFVTWGFERTPFSAAPLETHGDIEGHVRCISAVGFNNSSWHTSWSGNDSRKRNPVLWRNSYIIFLTAGVEVRYRKHNIAERFIEEIQNKYLQARYWSFICIQ